jgi:hypothetical protein
MHGQAGRIARVGLTAFLGGVLATTALIPLTGPVTLAAAHRHRPAAERDVRPDFDGDGFADLAVGAPYSNVIHANTGAVHVFHGTAAGLDGSRRRAWSQASRGITDHPELGDQFGWSVAGGDFDGDGRDDLAIGARWEGRNDSGAVHVLYGGRSGLTAARSRMWTQDSPGIADRGERRDGFGWVLAAADFDGDGRDDLAIAAQVEDGAATNSGLVHVLYGSRTGLTSQGSQVWSQDSPGIAERSQSNDRFGASLAAADFDGDGRDDLAIGVAYETRRINRDGAVHVLYGTRRGLSARGNQMWGQDSRGIAERAEERDQFGQSLAAGDLDGDGHDDLVVGAWFEDYRNSLSNEGGFHVIYGSRRGLTARGDQFWNQDSPGVQDRTHDSDRFGQALAVADFDGDGFDDVAVGLPIADVSGNIHANKGAVHVFFGSRQGLTARGDRYLTQDSPGVADRAEMYDHFGEALAGADFDADGFDDLVVGIPWEDLDVADEGAAWVAPGSARGLDLSRDRILSSRGSDLTLGQRRDGRFGKAVAGERAAEGSPVTNVPTL